MIRFENVSFNYPNSKMVTLNMYLLKLKGQKIGFIGETGSGKSTIIDLLHLLVPTSGSISIDGRNIDVDNSHLCVL